jgi:hypothetical protein
VNQLVLESIYRALLRHPHDKWRAENQWVYCWVRDEIAARARLPEDEVQNHFEAEAADWIARFSK